MANSYHDGNHTHTLLAIQSDGSTLKNVVADASTHALGISDGTTGSDNGPVTSRHDANHIAILMATSSTDGKTPIAVYTDSNGYLLVDSV